MKTHCPQDARRDDFRLCLGPELDAPLHSITIADVESRTPAASVACHERERRLPRHQFASAGTVIQIPPRDVVWRLPQLLERRRCVRNKPYVARDPSAAGCRDDASDRQHGYT
jgi:hypothetical protein